MSSSTQNPDPHQLEQRVKQVQYGKDTVEYKFYINKIPKQERTKECPRTPNVRQNCSKRSFAGQISKWRRQLHRFYDCHEGTHGSHGDVEQPLTLEELARQVAEAVLNDD